MQRRGVIALHGLHIRDVILLAPRRCTRAAAAACLKSGSPPELMCHCSGGGREASTSRCTRARKSSRAPAGLGERMHVARSSMEFDLAEAAAGS